MARSSSVVSFSQGAEVQRTESCIWSRSWFDWCLHYRDTLKAPELLFIWVAWIASIKAGWNIRTRKFIVLNCGRNLIFFECKLHKVVVIIDAVLCKLNRCIVSIIIPVSTFRNWCNNSVDLVCIWRSESCLCHTIGTLSGAQLLSVIRTVVVMIITGHDSRDSIIVSLLTVIVEHTIEWCDEWFH